MLVTSDINESIAVLTLNDPARRNVLSSAMMEELLKRLSEVEKSSDIRVVLSQHMVQCSVLGTISRSWQKGTERNRRSCSRSAQDSWRQSGSSPSR